ncbi:MAG: PAS domain S-box protein [Thermoplasmatota archaeon]
MTTVERDERTFEAERSASFVRAAVVAFNSLVYVFALDHTIGSRALAWTIIVVASAYGAYTLLAQPYRRYPVLTSAAATTATDAVLIVLWIVATGGIASPFYLLWYVSLAAVAFRFDARTTAMATVAYAALYVAVVAADGGLATHASEVLIRTGYIALVGAISALLAAQGTREAAARGELRVRVQEARTAENRFRGLLDAAPDAIVIVDRDERIAMANRQTEAVFGYTREELVGQPLSLLLPSVQTAGHGLGIETEARRRDGSAFPAEVSLSALETESGVLLTSVIRDVSERKQQERKLRESEEALRSVVESSPDLLMNVERDGTILFANRSLLGGDPADLVGTSAYDLVPPEERPRLRAIWERVFATGQTATYDLEAHGAGGRTAWLRSNAGPIRRDGHVVALVVNSSDITESKRGEDAIRESEARFRALSDAAFEGVVIYASDRILETNVAFAKLFGHANPSELVGRSLSELISPDSRSEFARRLGAETVDPFETTGRRVDGSPVSLEVVARTMPCHGSPVGVSAVRDITERKRAEQERATNLIQLRELERLKEVDEFKTQFINTAAHELNTPLTPIKLQVHLLKTAGGAGLDERQRRAVDVLERNVDRLGHLVRDVLDVARLQASRLGVVKRSTDLNRLVLESVESFQESARVARVELVATLTPDLSVEADPQRLTQVLFNLLSNALKFTPPGGVITVESRREHGAAIVRVKDTGAGLTTDQMSRLFRPFSQVHDTSQQTRAGTGLGLYISRGILELHDGTLNVASDGPGHGSTFTMALPVGEPLPPRPEPKAKAPHADAGERGEKKREDAIAKRARELI